MNINAIQCKGCSKCCYGWRIPLSNNDILKLSNDYYELIDGKYYLKVKEYKDNSVCIFLNTDKLICDNYINRPEVCKKLKINSSYCLDKIKNTKSMNSGIYYPYIKGFTIDPNEFCNAKCWYCVNKYRTQNSNILSIENFEKIIDKVLIERGNIVEENLNTIYTNHFNEILLYPYFEQMLQLFRNKKLETHIFSNGTPLTPEKYDLINKYDDVCKSIILNVPTIDREYWKKQTGMNDHLYDNLIVNLDYIHNNIKDIKITIQVNGINKNSYFNNGGNISKMSNFPEFINDDLDEQYNIILNKYPNFNIHKNGNLMDWGGYLENQNIYSLYLSNLLNNKKDNNRIIDCNCNHRIYNYLEINSKGDVFLCLDDVNFKTKYGNLLEQDLKEIWESDLRKKIIDKETKSGICNICNLAIWQK